MNISVTVSPSINNLDLCIKKSKTFICIHVHVQCHVQTLLANTRRETTQIIQCKGKDF